MQSKAQIDQILRQKSEARRFPAWSRWPHRQ